MREWITKHNINLVRGLNLGHREIAPVVPADLADVNEENEGKDCLSACGGYEALE